MLRKVATPVLVRLLSFSPFLCIYFFWRSLVSYRDEIWVGVMFPFLTLCLLGGFCFLCSVFFFGLIALFFWVFFVAVGCCGLLYFWVPLPPFLTMYYFSGFFAPRCSGSASSL
jgi:hypothetical protein